MKRFLILFLFLLKILSHVTGQGSVGIKPLNYYPSEHLQVNDVGVYLKVKNSSKDFDIYNKATYAYITGDSVITLKGTTIDTFKVVKLSNDIDFNKFFGIIRLNNEKPDGIGSILIDLINRKLRLQIGESFIEYILQ